MFWILLLLFVGSTVLSALLQNRQGVKASGLGDFTAPTADATRVIPVVWGTVKLTGANVIWYGDLKSKAIKQSSMFGLTSQTVGYKYYVGMWLGLCHGQVDDIVGLCMGTHPNDKVVPFTKSTIGDHARVSVNSNKLWGGDKAEGGIVGDFDFYYGTGTQGPNDYITNKLSLVGVGAGGVAFIPTYSGVGNGPVVNLQVTANTILETISVDFTGSTHFNVTGSVSGALGSGTVGNTFTCSVVSFKVNTGSSAFQIGDRIQFNTVPASTGGAPAYPNLCHMVARQVYMGTSNYLKNLSPIVQRCTAADVLGLGSKANISGDANPANIIYECMTNTVWGQGRPSSMFDLSSFIAAGNTLYAEGLGLSIQLDNPQQTDTFVTDILSHIDGAIYTDPSTGLWTLKLARADYDPNTLPTFNENNITEAPEFFRPSWDQTLNQIYITFVSRSQNYTDQRVKADESANFATTGERLAQTITLKGISNSTTAQLVAMRELKQHAYPIAQLKMVCNRTGWNLRIGGCFKFSWSSLGINSLIMRVTSVNYGALENGRIEVQACEDIYNVTLSAFSAPPVSAWVDPLSSASAPLAQLAFEVPYGMLNATNATTQVWVGAVRADLMLQGFEVWADEGAGYYESNVFDGFMPSGTLNADYSRTTAALDASGFVLTGSADLDDVAGTDAGGRVRGDCLLMFMDTGEICAFQTCTGNADGTYTFTNIVRGVLDTLPADHTFGTRVVIFRDAGLYHVTNYQTTVIIDSGVGDVIGS